MQTVKQYFKTKMLIIFFSCHPWTGFCECLAGWDGMTCSRPCPLYTFGQGCRRKCVCNNNAQCLPNNGTCICGLGMFILYFFKEPDRIVSRRIR